MCNYRHPTRRFLASATGSRRRLPIRCSKAPSRSPSNRPPEPSAKRTMNHDNSTRQAVGVAACGLILALSPTPPPAPFRHRPREPPRSIPRRKSGPAKAAASDHRSDPRHGACVPARQARSSRGLADRAQRSQAAEATGDHHWQTVAAPERDVRAEARAVTTRGRAPKPMHDGAPSSRDSAQSEL